LRHPWSWKDLTSSIIWGIALLVQIVLAILFFNTQKANVLVYGSAVVFGGFLVKGWLARIVFQRKGGIPVGQSCVDTTVLVDSGIYAVVRHPMYASWNILSLALVLLSQHWLSVVLSCIATLFLYYDAWREDQSLLHKFGQAYKNYMNRVPRANILGGIYRVLINKSNQTS
jgi:protein-S-isoprenylcysteine O-methyltransferase Ste14